MLAPITYIQTNAMYLFSDVSSRPELKLDRHSSWIYAREHTELEAINASLSLACRFSAEWNIRANEYRQQTEIVIRRLLCAQIESSGCTSAAMSVRRKLQKCPFGFFTEPFQKWNDTADRKCTLHAYYEFIVYESETKKKIILQTRKLSQLFIEK